MDLAIASDELSIETFLARPDLWEQIEIYDGVPRATTGVGARHGEFTVAVASALWEHVKPRGLGRVYRPSTRCVLQTEPLRVLAPDVSVVRSDRVPPEEQRDLPLLVAPDVAVEIVSPWSPEHVVDLKRRYYLDAGVPLIIVVDAIRYLVFIHELDRTSRTVAEGKSLDGGDVVPGFTLPVAEIFR